MSSKTQKYIYKIGFLLFVAAALIAVFLRSQGNDVEILRNSLPKTLPMRQDEVTHVLPVLKADNQNRQNFTGPATEAFQKCFAAKTPPSLQAATQWIRSQKKFAPPIMVEENIHLVDARGRKFVVQYLPSEEAKEQVRLFILSPYDGLPDRMQDFEGAQLPVQKRLQSALSKGKIEKRMTTTVENGADSESLETESTKDQILVLRYSDGQRLFECREQKCSCLKLPEGKFQ